MTAHEEHLAFNTPTQVPPRFPDTEERIAALEAALEERILVLDGATGTALQAANLTAADFGGPDLEGCNEMLCAARPDVVAGVHERYLRAGADIVETNTFGATSIVLAEYDVADRAFELNQRAARIARETCARFDHAGSPALRVRLDGPDHQGDLGHRRRHLRAAARSPTASRRAA